MNENHQLTVEKYDDEYDGDGDGRFDEHRTQCFGWAKMCRRFDDDFLAWPAAPFIFILF